MPEPQMSAVSAGSDEILQRLVDTFVFSVAFDAVEPLALGEFGTCVVSRPARAACAPPARRLRRCADPPVC